MYNRVEELKELLSKIEEFNNAIYDEGILKDIRFKFKYHNETFLLVYKLDYSNPRLYLVKKDKVLTEVKEFIIPKTIKTRIDEITNKISDFNMNYYPLIPGHEYKVGAITFQSKFFNEYANKHKTIDFLSNTYNVFFEKEKINEVEILFSKKQNEWGIEKVIVSENDTRQQIIANLSIFENEIIKKLNQFEQKEDLLMQATDLFLKGTE